MTASHALDVLKSKIKKRKELQSVPLDCDTIEQIVKLVSQNPHLNKTEIMRLAIQYALEDENFLRALKELKDSM